MRVSFHPSIPGHGHKLHITLLTTGIQGAHLFVLRRLGPIVPPRDAPSHEAHVRAGQSVLGQATFERGNALLSSHLLGEEETKQDSALVRSGSSGLFCPVCLCVEEGSSLQGQFANIMASAPA